MYQCFYILLWRVHQYSNWRRFGRKETNLLNYFVSYINQLFLCYIFILIIFLVSHDTWYSRRSNLFQTFHSDCVNDCYQDKMRHLCKSDRGFFISLSLLRKDQLLNKNQTLKSCYDPDFNKFNFTLYMDCNKICKVECNFIYYPYEIEIIEHPEHQLRIRHGEYPDIFVEHLPETTFIGFVCNFGGLLGMWLGLSLFTIFNNIFNLVTKIDYQKCITYNNFTFTRCKRLYRYKINNLIR